MQFIITKALVRLDLIVKQIIIRHRGFAKLHVVDKMGIRRAKEAAISRSRIRLCRHLSNRSFALRRARRRSLGLRRSRRWAARSRARRGHSMRAARQTDTRRA